MSRSSRRKRSRRIREYKRTVYKQIEPVPIRRYVARINTIKAQISPRGRVKRAISSLIPRQKPAATKKVDATHAEVLHEVRSPPGARKTCKMRPNSTKAAKKAKGNGTSRAFIPWCTRKS